MKQPVKQWVQKLIDQLNYDFSGSSKDSPPPPVVDLTEERATLLYIIDVYNKNLLDIENHPVRKVRDTLDEFAKALVNPEHKNSEKILFRLRQWFSSYRIDEYTYIQKTFDDFKGIVWDFADQLAEDIRQEKKEDAEVQANLEELKEAVEANSIDTLRTKAREFIDSYIETHTRREERQDKRISFIKENLSHVKKQLMEANQSMRLDHLTSAFNRKSFDEQIKKHHSMYHISKIPVSLLILDIDFFKKINDTYGHDIGDFVLKECVALLKGLFHRDLDFVARIGGEEFAVILPEHAIEHAIKKAENALSKIRSEVFIVKENIDLKFTISMGIAQLVEGETVDMWIKRADSALYEAKNSGRNRFIIAPPHLSVKKQVA